MMKAMKEQLEKIEKENEGGMKVVEPTKNNGFTEEKHVGEVNITYTPGGTIVDVDKLKKLLIFLIKFQER